MKRIVAIVLALAVGPAEAGDDSQGLAIPDHWRELPEMVRAAPEDDAISVVSRGAWGDPVAGVFFTAQVIDTNEKANPTEIRRALLASLGDAEIEVQAPDPTGDPIVLEFSAAGFSGAVIAQISPQTKGKQRVRSVACFYNQREPELSEQLCKSLLTQFSASL